MPCLSRQTHSAEYLQRAQRYPKHYRPTRFPWLEVVVLTPCAVLAALGVKVPWTASALVRTQTPCTCRRCPQCWTAVRLMHSGRSKLIAPEPDVVAVLWAGP